ncbi:hypothetical protein ElyMa_000274500 [Elysia marginata]|uniref:Uncharacterized protein n=1 Tax=Elysia marginata TaxID=1093978 RepID=A0AAV4F5M6_9GAST|nr:hypothetical protein ElyMa_000274500 [Elysia marginata]
MRLKWITVEKPSSISVLKETFSKFYELDTCFSDATAGEIYDDVNSDTVDRSSVDGAVIGGRCDDDDDGDDDDDDDDDNEYNSCDKDEDSHDDDDIDDDNDGGGGACW